MIHRTAMTQLTAVDRKVSSQINLVRALSESKDEKAFQSEFERNFDALIITMSNVIRKGESDGNALPLLQLLETPLYVIGVGLQDRLRNGLADLSPQMADVLRVINAKARLFGVRGHLTEKWLHDHGLKHAVAIGCPSMFVYPRSIARIAAPVNPKRFFVAGHLHTKNLLPGAKNQRAIGMLRAFNGYDASYVCQTEIDDLTGESANLSGIYDESTSQLDAAYVNRKILELSGIASPFTRYYSFNEVAAWRQVAAHHDVYIGDRIHGGVAAMQVGVPALVLYADARVQELTAYHGIPSCSVDEFLANGVDASVKKYLNDETIDKFKRRYSLTLRKFKNTLKTAGLPIANEADMDFAISEFR